MTKFLDTAGLTYFFTGLKKIFVRKVNGTAPDANGNVTINNMSAATSSAAGKAGLVPAPAAGAQAKYLRGDGTWQTPPNTTYSNMKGASTSAAGTAGLAPAPAAGAANRYLRSDGTWAVPPDNNTTYSNMTGATASAAGKAGLVPAPAAGKNNMPLCGDATFKTLPIAGGGTGATTALNAIKAFLGSSAIGSTTKPVYYDGNGALKACADSIGGGGIVAALLEQNGYVKFANGLIIQWGTWVNGTNTYPIAFTKFAQMACIGEYSFGGRDNNIDTVDLTSATATKKSSLLTQYIVVGV